MSTPPSEPQPQPQPAGYPPPGYPPPGYGPASSPGHPGGYPPPWPQQPVKRRPSAWWFLPGAVALAIALVAAGFAIAIGIQMYATDGYVQPGGRPQPVLLDDAGDHMLFADAAGFPPSCAVAEGGRLLPLTRVDEDITVELGETEWRPFAEFTTGGTEITVRCTGATSTIRVGAPAGEDEILTLGLGAIAAVGFGVLGVAGLIIVLVLFLSRPSRKITG